MSQQNETDDLVAAAGGLLAERFGETVRIRDIRQLTEPGRRNQVWRCFIEEESNHLPDSLILKQVVIGQDESGDWDRFFRDWAGAQFLSSMEGVRIGPEFHGGDRQAGLLLTEDLGEAPQTLVPLLLGGDPGQAEKGLSRLAAQLGRMHARAAGRYEEYQQIYRAAAGKPYDPEDDLERVKGFRKAFIQACHQFSVRLSAGCFQDMGLLEQNFFDPGGPFWTFTHSDACPDNVYIKDDQLRLIDFEGSRFRHALLEAACFRMSFPTCWCSNRLPEDLVSRLESIYREELSEGIPQAADADLFERSLTEACGAWVMISFSQLVRHAAKEDGKWGIAPIRSRVLSRLESFLQLATRVGHLAGLAEVTSQFQDHFRKQWPESTSLPLFPAFRGTVR